jgi:TRAP-type mannitol/chloroaromatic compound transport system permease large subunit
MITPPFGYTLFYFRGIGLTDVSMTDVYRAIIPYIPIWLIVLVLSMVFPYIPLCLPNMMIK